MELSPLTEGINAEEEIRRAEMEMLDEGVTDDVDDTDEELGMFDDKQEELDKSDSEKVRPV
jgi:hypothetical protein